MRYVHFRTSVQVIDIPPVTTPNDQVLDLPTLDRLAELDVSGTRQVVAKVLLTYERALEKALSELQNAARIHDLSALGRVAHTLRSSSASVGALGLASHCAALEQAIRQGADVDVREASSALHRECCKVVVAVGQLLVARGYRA
jgi:HPt (histidine-containing phosphotransfer) domain-containing protein